MLFPRVGCRLMPGFAHSGRKKQAANTKAIVLLLLLLPLFFLRNTVGEEGGGSGSRCPRCAAAASLRPSPPPLQMHPPLRDRDMGQPPVTRHRPGGGERCRGLPRARVWPPEVWESPKAAVSGLGICFLPAWALEGFRGAVGLVQCHVFESAKLVSAFLFCLAKD